MSANETKQLPVTTPPVSSSSLLLLLTLLATCLIVTCSSVNFNSQQHLQLQEQLHPHPHPLSAASFKIKLQPLTTSASGSVTSFREEQIKLFPPSEAAIEYGPHEWLFKYDQPHARRDLRSTHSSKSSRGHHGYPAVGYERRQFAFHDSSPSNAYSDDFHDPEQLKFDASNDWPRSEPARPTGRRPSRGSSGGSRQCSGGSGGGHCAGSRSGSSGRATGLRPARRGLARASLEQSWLDSGDPRPNDWSFPDSSGYDQPSFERGIVRQSANRFASNHANEAPVQVDVSSLDHRPASPISSFTAKSSHPQDTQGDDKHYREVVERFYKKIKSIQPRRKARSNSLYHSMPPPQLPFTPSRHSFQDHRLPDRNNNNQEDDESSFDVTSSIAGYQDNGYNSPDHSVIELPRTAPPKMSHLTSASGISFPPENSEETRVPRSLSIGDHYSLETGSSEEQEQSDAEPSSAIDDRNFDPMSHLKGLNVPSSLEEKIPHIPVTSRVTSKKRLSPHSYSLLAPSFITGGSTSDDGTSDQEPSSDLPFAGEKISRSGMLNAARASDADASSLVDPATAMPKRGNSWSRQYWRKFAPDESQLNPIESVIPPSHGFDGYLQGLYGTPPPPPSGPTSAGQVIGPKGNSKAKSRSSLLTMDNLPILDPLPQLDKTLMENFFRGNSKLPSALLGSDSFSDPRDSDRPSGANGNNGGDSSRSESNSGGLSSSTENFLKNLRRIPFSRFTSLFSPSRGSSSDKRTNSENKESSESDDDDDDSNSCSDSNESADSRHSYKIADPPTSVVANFTTSDNVTSTSSTSSASPVEVTSLTPLVISSPSSLSSPSSSSSLESAFISSSSNETITSSELISSSVKPPVATESSVTTPLVM